MIFQRRVGAQMTVGFANDLFAVLPLHSPAECPHFTESKTGLISQWAAATSRLIDEFNDLAVDFRIFFSRKTKRLRVL